MLLTCIPPNNLAIQRLEQYQNLGIEYKVTNSFFDAVKELITDKDIKFVEIWYSHHSLLLLIAAILNKRCFYSPVLCDHEWFKIKKKFSIKDKRYSFKRLRMTFYNLINIILAEKIFIQDSSFINLWSAINFFNKEIVVVHNTFPIVKKIHKNKNIDYLIVSHDAQHKIKHLDRIYNLVKGKRIVWVGSVSNKTKNKYPSIEYCGKLKQEDLFEYYKKSKTLIVTSIFEGSPRSIYEALSYECNIFAYDLKGTNDLRQAFPENFLRDLDHEQDNIVDPQKIAMWNQESINTKRKSLNA